MSPSGCAAEARLARRLSNGWSGRSPWCGSSGFGERCPGQLSGGQQQRVAIARAIAPEPRVLLFDEPLSNLDAQLRDEMQIELKRLQRSLGVTTLFVTHDQERSAVDVRPRRSHGAWESCSSSGRRRTSITGP